MADPRIAFFDNLAANWDNENPSADDMTAVLEKHKELLDLRSGDTILEVGCGTGKTTPWFVEQVAPGAVTAVDFSPEMIARAKSKSIGAEFICTDVCCDDMGTDRFEAVICLHSFPHFRDQPTAIKILSRAIKPGGKLIVMHIAGSQHINSFHANLDAAVNVDMLPVGKQWEPLVKNGNLNLEELIDREDLFFMKACKPS